MKARQASEALSKTRCPFCGKKSLTVRARMRYTSYREYELKARPLPFFGRQIREIEVKREDERIKGLGKLYCKSGKCRRILMHNFKAEELSRLAAKAGSLQEAINETGREIRKRELKEGSRHDSRMRINLVKRAKGPRSQS